MRTDTEIKAVVVGVGIQITDRRNELFFGQFQPFSNGIQLENRLIEFVHRTDSDRMIISASADDGESRPDYQKII